MSDYTALKGFSSGLFSCIDDPMSCLLVWCVPCAAPLLHGTAVQRATKTDSCIGPFCLDILLCCVGAAINRGKLRDAYGIEGSFCVDCLTYLCCGACAVCQEWRESQKSSSSLCDYKTKGSSKHCRYSKHESLCKIIKTNQLIEPVPEQTKLS